MAPSNDPLPNTERRTGKRKRSEHTSDWDPCIVSAQRKSADAATSFCRSPSERLQLSLAGLADTERDPTRGIRHFPHRALAARDVDGEPHDQDQPGPRGQRGAEYGKHVDVLLRSLHQMLDQGNISRAERAYSTLLQLRRAGRPIDVRQHQIWALGAEILMRAGEKPRGPRDADHIPDGSGGDDGPCSHVPSHGFFIPARWGSSANIVEVKAYFETLIQQYPYDHKFPRSVSALDFQLAMLGCEIYHVHTLHTSGLTEEQTGKQAHRAEGKPGTALNREHGLPAERRGRSRGRRARDVHAQALLVLQDITQRMDALMQGPPYRTNHDFLRLRATASRYAADLLAATLRTTPEEKRNAIERTMHLQQQAAADALSRVAHNGREVDETKIADSGDRLQNEKDVSASSLHSSLPIRRIRRI